MHALLLTKCLQLNITSLERTASILLFCCTRFFQDYGKRGLLRLSLSLPIVRAIAVNRIHVTPCNEHLEPELETTLTSVSGVSYEVRSEKYSKYAMQANICVCGS